MFDFFKRKQETSTEVLITPNEETNDQDNDVSKIGFGYAASESARISTQQAAERFAKPSTYTGNRNLYDSGVAKKQAKLNLFKDGTEVIDPYTGNKLVLTKQEARMMYGDEWQMHLAESDHVKPLEQIYKDTKDNVWATTDDIRTVANSDNNIRVSSRKFNNPKRSRTNKEYVENEEYLQSKCVELTEDGRQVAIKDGEIAEKSTSRQIMNVSTKNVLKTGHDAGKYGAKNAGVTALTMSGIMNFVAVVKGKKSSDEAIVDTIKDGGKAAVTGYAMGGGLTVVSHSLSNSSSNFIQALSKSNVPGKVITAVIVTGDTLKRYGNGEITTQECLVELGDKGLNLATMGYSMAVGQALIPIPIVGGAIGALVGSALTSMYYNNLINTLQTKQLEHKERQRIIAECNKAAEQTKVFREELEDYLKSYFKEYRDCFNEALSGMRFAYQAWDADGIIAGANQISRKLGGQVHYESVEEFKRFLDDVSIDIL